MIVTQRPKKTGCLLYFSVFLLLERAGITYEKIVTLEDNGEYECSTSTTYEGLYTVFANLVVLNATAFN